MKKSLLRLLTGITLAAGLVSLLVCGFTIFNFEKNEGAGLVLLLLGPSCLLLLLVAIRKMPLLIGACASLLIAYAHTRLLGLYLFRDGLSWSSPVVIVLSSQILGLISSLILTIIQWRDRKPKVTAEQ